MRDMAVGMVIVGLVAGIFIGRHTTKSRRSYADQKSAKTTYDKYRSAFFVDTRNAVIAVGLAAAFLIAILVGMINYPES